MTTNPLSAALSESPAGDVQDLIDNKRQLSGPMKTLMLCIACAWSVFQLWYASPLPFILHFGILNDTQARAIHLSFALFLVYTLYPAFKHSPTHRIPYLDALFAFLGAFAAGYLFLFYDRLSLQAGAPQPVDLLVSGVGVVLLLEATRRTLGPPLTIVALVFLTYCFAGPYMPDIIAHQGASFSRAMSHFWLTTEGVFGVALGVSTNFVFLFVLFGALLDQAGAGNYFIRLSFSLLGQFRGGPAKAAVVSSGLSGMISGSSIANVVTTGTFTIPLMKRSGFPASKAGAIEVAASTNGQLTPPIMGAAAFLMVEYVGIPYIEVIKAAILPAIISYIALFYIVHLEAVKANMTGMGRERPVTAKEWLLGIVASFLLLCVLSFAVYYGIGWIKQLAGDYSLWVIGVVLLLVYLALLKLSATQPDLPVEPAIDKAPRIRRTTISGLYFLLPVVSLVWCLTIERFSPGLSAFWSTLLMIFIILTQHPLKAWFRQQPALKPAFYLGLRDLVQGFEMGAANMISIGIATATAGIIVGTVTLTGIGLIMTSFVEYISMGSIMLTLLFTALISLVLGMGLPTTANYIVVSTLMAPVIVELGAQHGLLIPLIAAHLFVFYFGILADDTPPVGLGAFAAAGIAKADPIKTGLQGFAYDIRTAILPFMFIFNTQLLLIGVTSGLELILVIASALGAMLVFAIATQGHWLTKVKWHETLVLLLISFVLFRPGFFWDMIYPPYKTVAATQVLQVVKDTPANHAIRLVVSGDNIDGKRVNITTNLPLGPAADPIQRLEYAGLTLAKKGNQMIVDQVTMDSPADKLGIDFDWQIDRIEQPNQRPNSKWLFIPALLLLGMLYMGQKKRVSAQKTV